MKLAPSHLIEVGLKLGDIRGKAERIDDDALRIVRAFEAAAPDRGKIAALAKQVAHLGRCIEARASEIAALVPAERAAVGPAEQEDDGA